MNGANGLSIVFSVQGQEVSTSLRMIGEHNATNAACALATACALGIAPEDAARGLRDARPPSMRGELDEVAGRSIYLDCYNANPDSMTVALNTIAALAKGCSAVAILGDMLELGDQAKDDHIQIGRLAQHLGVQVIALGDHAEHICAGAGNAAQMADSHEQAAQLALDRSHAGDWVLIKASRGMKLEGVLNAMKQISKK